MSKPQDRADLPVKPTFRPEMVYPKKGRCILSLCLTFRRKALPNQVGKDVKGVKITLAISIQFY
ncbi:hypothetical protein CYANOKiyG1_20380 [Okeania sp. KiyG1]|nr:hypothetical protein CYANOKiyG1_20380 [Okeania sp. KiyG1]